MSTLCTRRVLVPVKLNDATGSYCIAGAAPGTSAGSLVNHDAVQIHLNSSKASESLEQHLIRTNTPKSAQELTVSPVCPSL